MKIQAKFIGEDSLGYVHGQVYELFVIWNTIERLDKGNKGTCPYKSLSLFLKNWTDIKHL